MEKLIGTKNSLRRNGKQGFTLIELIVVIIIIAILIAALTPAVLGVIDKARQASDEVEARSVMMAASVWALGNSKPPASRGDIDLIQIIAEMQGGSQIEPANIKALYFDGFICTRVDYIRQAKEAVTVGAAGASTTPVYSA